MVVQSTDNWYDTQTEVRNNEQLWLTPEEEKTIPMLRHIYKRISRTAHVPDEYQEAMQIGRYNTSTKYEVHLDTDPDHKVGRPATLITYLEDAEEGGETLFPVGRNDCTPEWREDPKTGEKIWGVRWCCMTPGLDASETVRVRPKKGRSVLFYSHTPDGRIDGNAKHAACPVTKGEKWIAQRWLRFEPYQQITYTDAVGSDARFDGLPGPGRHDASASPILRTLSNKQPRIYLAEGFASPEECRLLLSIASANLTALDAQPAEFLGSSRSSSAGAAAAAAQQEPEHVAIERDFEDGHEHLRALAQRSHLLVHLPNATSRLHNVTRWPQGSAEAPHMDSQPPSAMFHVSVLIFLNDVMEGGEIFFPRLEGCSESEKIEVCCAKSKLKVPGRAGDALVIYSHTLDGFVDEMAAHGACPVAQGVRWVSERRFHFEHPPTFASKDVAAAAAKKAAAHQFALEFENKLRDPVEVFWVDHANTEVSMGIIAAGPAKVKVINTFQGHHFRVRKVEDREQLLDLRAQEAGRHVIKSLHKQDNKVDAGGDGNDYSSEM
eukprot:TRINITY_DN73227_c0_g1_i2.p1 TRINITY_DN73227_c0_g1~~TRINITY_DN73227_c0_g1_i2.p1  ORF type:complete len:549 (+),score=98.84 TRINITY_DN73227_c0_g1_i2:207-1853(+)